MSVITYIKKVPLWKTIFGVSSFLFGIITLGFGMILAGLFIIGLSVSLITTQGAQLDLTAGKYRRVKSIVGIHFGTWQAFPGFEYISIFTTKLKQSVTVAAATTASSEPVIVLNLFYKGNKYLTVYQTTDRSEAFKVAERFRKILNIDVLDATGSEKHWVDPA